MGKVMNTISIVLYGDITCNSKAWLEWYDYSTRMISFLELSPNYIGISSESFDSGKLLQLKRAESRVKKVINEGERIMAMSIYSLPENFVQAAFDYDVYLGRKTIGIKNHVILTLNQELFPQLNIDKTIGEMKQHINFESGEVFEMMNIESPQFYATKVNPSSAYKSLKIVKVF